MTQVKHIREGQTVSKGGKHGQQEEMKAKCDT